MTRLAPMSVASRQRYGETELARNLRQAAEQAQLTVACDRCTWPGYTGPALEALKKARQHRNDAPKEEAMTRVEATFTGSVPIPDGATVGTTFAMRVEARIVGIEDDLVDVTSYGSGEPQFVEGRRNVKLIITKATAA